MASDEREQAWRETIPAPWRQTVTDWMAHGRTARHTMTGTTPDRYREDVLDYLAYVAGHPHLTDPFQAVGAHIDLWARTRPGPKPPGWTEGDPRPLSTSIHAYERRVSAVLNWYTWCHAAGLCAGVPQMNRRSNYDGVPGLRILTPREREALIEAVTEWQGGRRQPEPERDQLVVRLMLWKLRPRQIVGLDVTDLHGQGHAMTADLLYPKGDGLDRAQDVPYAVARAIDRYLPVRHGPPGTGPLLTTRSGRRMDPNVTPTRILRAIMATHPDLRETAATITPDGVAMSAPERQQQAPEEAP